MGLLGGGKTIRILKRGPAARVIFFYPGEEGTYVDHANVTLFENGIVHIQSAQEESTTHLQNCEIIWRLEAEGDDRANKVRILKLKAGEGPELKASREKNADHGSDAQLDSANPANPEQN